MSELTGTARPRFSRSAAIGVAIGCIALVGAGVTWRILQPSPQQLLDQALALVPHDSPKAERLLLRAIDAAGGHFPDAEVALSRSLIRRKAWDQAESRLTSMDPAQCRSDLLLACGRDALPTRFRVAALDMLESVGQRPDREGISALELLASHYLEWGQREKLIKVETRLTQRDPENPKYWGALIEHLASFGRDTECLEAMREALQHRWPAQIRRKLQYSLVQQLVNQGDAVAARREFTELSKIDGRSIQVRGQEVYLCRLEGQLDKALELATAIVKEAPDLVFAHFTRGIVCLDKRLFDEAVKELEQTIAAEPFNAPAHFKLSEAHRGLQRENLAAEHRRIAAEIVEKQKRISTLMKSREEDPLNPEVYHELEQLHQDLGDSASARVWHQWAERVANLNNAPR